MAEIIQQKGYYSFGMEISQFSAGTGTNKNWYNGKEIQDDFGLYWYDYGARFYDPQLGRWHTLDPMAEESRSWSPYSYAFDNPMRFIDPDGQFPIETIWDIGNVIYDVGAAIYNHAKGDHEAARSNWTDAGMDAGAMLIPYVPAGASKLIKAGDKAVDAAKTINKTEKLQETAKTGQEAHRQIQKELREQGAKTEVKVTLKDGSTVRKDAVKPDGTKVIIKPETPSGQKSAATREKKMQDNGHKTEKLFYDPKDPKYQSGSPSYIGPKK